MFSKKKICCCFLMFTVNYSTNAMISANTTNTIQGNAPILSDLGIEALRNNIFFTVKKQGKVTDGDEWQYEYTIASTNSDDVYFSLDTQFNNVSISVAQNALTNDDIDDVDGDMLSDTNPFNISNINYSWFDKNGTEIDNTSTALMGAEICTNSASYMGPFKLNTSFDAVINTKYGDPFTSETVSIERSFNVNANDGICYARPGVLSLNIPGGWPEGSDAWNAGRNSIQRSPAFNSDVFIRSVGFKSWTETKFPTTAFPEARFRLVPLNAAANYDISIKDNPNNALISQNQYQVGQFKFGDTRASQSDIYTVEIKPKDKSNVSYFYNFKLKSSKSWFELGPTQKLATGTGQNYSTAVSDCGVSNLPTRSELTNSIYANSATWPPSEYAVNNGFMRDYGNLTAEWGHVYYYAPYTLNDKRDMMASVTENLKRYYAYWYYWTNEIGPNSSNHHSVGFVEGNVGIDTLNEKNGGIMCVY